MKLIYPIISLLLILLQFTEVVAQADDTLRLMSYNLLNYRNNTIPGCSNTNNNPTTKESALDEIVSHVQPHILLCNEIGTSDPAASFRIAQNALNQSGRNYYSFTNMQTGQRQNINSSSTGNMIYWDNRVLELHSSDYIEFDPFNRALVRVIDLYTLYYKDPNLSVHNDTAFIHVFIAHLKAGNTTSDRDERDWATDAVMAYLDSNNLQGNYLMAGDLNLYTASENAYQNLLNYPVSSFRFFDPVNVSGNWSNNSPFAIVHTQSTRTTSNCGAAGGMDDRFDFILASDEIMNGTDKLEYIANSYEVVGQDGQHFNSAVNASPTNNSAPANVIQALFDLSDHLPVILDMEVNLPQSTFIAERDRNLAYSYTNPVKDQLTIRFENGHSLDRIEILDMRGKKMLDLSVRGKRIVECNLDRFKEGIYLIRSIDRKGAISTQKLIKI